MPRVNVQYLKAIEVGGFDATMEDAFDAMTDAGAAKVYTRLARALQVERQVTGRNEADPKGA